LIFKNANVVSAASFKSAKEKAKEKWNAGKRGQSADFRGSIFLSKIRENPRFFYFNPCSISYLPRTL
jgi:hypothetical protein